MMLLMMMRTAATLRALLSLSPPPLWGRARERGGHERCLLGLPLSPTLPQRKSGLPDLRKINCNPGKPGLLGRGKDKSMPRGGRPLLPPTALLAAIPAAALAQVRDDIIAAPVLRANVTVSGA